MGAYTDTQEDIVNNYIFRDVAAGYPTSFYVALFTVAPGETGGGTEVTGGSYARQAVVRTPTGSSRFASSSAGATSNLDIITFPTASASWGTIVAAAVMSAVSAGTAYLYGNLVANKTVSSGDTFKFNVGDFSASVD